MGWPRRSAFYNANYLYLMKRFMKTLAAGAAIVGAMASCAKKSESGAYTTPAIPRDADIEAKVEKTLSKMSLDEKIGQMVQLSISTVLDESLEKVDEEKLKKVIGTYKVGSILNVIHDRAHSAAYTAEVVKRFQEVSMQEIGIPCIYGLDQIHGATYLTDGTFFPQEINLAATFDPVHATNMGEAMAYETRASLTPWIFSPVMDLGRDARWSRGWESWGEDAYLSAVMAEALVKADQGEDPNHIPSDRVAACAKHYLAYGAPASGKDRTPAYVSPLDLREKYFEPFRRAIRAGALSVMANSASVNGVPVHASHKFLTEWLKEGLNWDGMIVTDWADVNNLYTREHVAADKVEALAVAVNAGIDMIMDPYDVKCCTDLRKAVDDGLIPVSRIDDAVARVLRLKYRLGLFDNPVWDTSTYKMGREEYRKMALQAAVESEVLLKNADSLLPIKPGSRILVTGPNANSMRALNGGWSYTWQGADSKEFIGDEAHTIYDALKAKFDYVTLVEGVSYVPGADWQAEDASGIPYAVAAAMASDIIVACVGENSYCETPGNMNDLNLSKNQKDLVRALASTGKPIVLVLNEGRPRLIGDIEPLCKAVVDVFLPSNYGGDALALLLSGEENFSGKMPISYPKWINALHNYDHKVSESVATMSGAYNYDAKIDVQWLFGDGLSYTTFEYSDIKVVDPMTGAEVGGYTSPKSFSFDMQDLVRRYAAGETLSDEEQKALAQYNGWKQESEKEVEKKVCASFDAGDDIVIRVKVTNTGSRAGKEAVLLYSSDIVASIVPDNRRLRAFTKISLDPGESKVVELKVPASSLAFVGEDGKWRLEKGDFRVSVGSQYVILHCDDTKVWPGQNIM